jgi:hypothetical protein
MNVLLGLNVVLNVLLVRQPWFAEASQVWDANLNGKITAGIAAFSVPTLHPAAPQKNRARRCYRP